MLGIFSLKIIILAPKRIYYTRSHPNPKPLVIVDDPEKSLRRSSILKSQGSNNPPHRADSLPKDFSTLQDIEFDLPFEHSLFITKSTNSVDQKVVDQATLKHRSFKVQSAQPDIGLQIIQDFGKLQGLVLGIHLFCS